MFAVVKTGGKQYIVREGDILKTELLEAEVGKTVELPVLMVSEDDGSKLEIGKPTLKSNATATVVEHGRDKKISVIKFKSKVRYRRNVGHRQPFTKIKIDKIS